MPTVLRRGPYRIFFYSGDRPEPPHVHVERETMVAKLWLNPVAVAVSGGFALVELRRIAALVDEQREQLMESWNEFFAD